MKLCEMMGKKYTKMAKTAFGKVDVTTAILQAGFSTRAGLVRKLLSWLIFLSLRETDCLFVVLFYFYCPERQVAD